MLQVRISSATETNTHQVRISLFMLSLCKPEQYYQARILLSLSMHLNSLFKP
jgi:hypothetical protein